MLVAVLFSGGKDSTLALAKSMEEHQVMCLVTLISKNSASYMFHTPNIDLTKLQAYALNFPIIQTTTEGRKEDELIDLKVALVEAKKRFFIDGVVSGAIESSYQRERVQRVCDELDLSCLNPLWKMKQDELLRELVRKGYRVIISGVFAYPLDKSWLGKELDEDVIARLIALKHKYGISPSGEGGEIETTVLDGPIFHKRIRVTGYAIEEERTSAVLVVKKAILTSKLEPGPVSG